jgi:hypothetical protein
VVTSFKPSPPLSNSLSRSDSLSKQEVIDSEVLALEKLVDAGWWDESSAAQSSLKRPKKTGGLDALGNAKSRKKTSKFGQFKRLKVLQSGFGNHTAEGKEHYQQELRCLTLDDKGEERKLWLRGDFLFLFSFFFLFFYFFFRRMVAL